MPGVLGLFSQPAMKTTRLNPWTQALRVCVLIAAVTWITTGKVTADLNSRVLIFDQDKQTIIWSLDWLKESLDYHGSVDATN